MNNNITYRKAVKADINTVTELLYRLFDIPWDELLEENNQHFANPGMIFILAFDKAKHIGISHGSLRREYVNGANNGLKGYLEAIYVMPEYRLRGVAAGLVEATQDWAAQNGCREFASDCMLDNDDSYNFHLKIGFKETERNIFFLKALKPLGYEIKAIDTELRKRVQPVLDDTWGAPVLAINGKLWDSREMPGFAAVGVNGKIFGYLLYENYNNEHSAVEIMVLESIVQSIGVATSLIEEVKKAAKNQGADKLIVQTSNDNIKAIRFYQRRGFTIRAVRLGALDAARRLKPSIPLIGDNEIPLRDEIEFELEL